MLSDDVLALERNLVSETPVKGGSDSEFGRSRRIAP
jgi:hypothetical protein